MAAGGGQVVRAQAQPIIQDLPLGPDPTGGGPSVPQWMSSFDAALSAGMGLKITLPTALQSGIDQLIVYGVDESGDPAAGAAALGGLLDAHYYTDGMSYVVPGTPSNNTDTVTAGYDPALDGLHRRLPGGGGRPHPGRSRQRRADHRRSPGAGCHRDQHGRRPRASRWHRTPRWRRRRPPRR